MDKKQTKNRQGNKERYTLTIESGGIIAKPHEELASKNAHRSAWYVLGLVGDIGYAIALPPVGGAILGAYIDRQFSFPFRATLVGLVLGIVLAGVRIRQIINELSAQH